MSSPDSWLIRSVEVDGQLLDCRIADGRVVELGPQLSPALGESIIEAAGGALLPGLADHHIHVMATAAARRSIDLDGAESLPATPPDEGTGWLRVVGAGRPFSRAELDQRWPDRPVRVQHRSGAMWMLNSQAINLIGHGLTVQEQVTGQVLRGDDRLRDLMGASADLPESIRALGRELASYGITHLTDATPDLDAHGLELIRSSLPQRVTSMGPDGHAVRKIVVPDHEAPDFAQLVETIATCHAQGRSVALHSVTQMSLALCIAALDEAGVLCGDRIEHAAMCADDAALRLAELGVVVVTQPTIYARRRDLFLRETPEREQDLLWRHAGLLREGVAVVVSSDAPYGDTDPAATIAACAVRGIESVGPRDVLTSYLLDPQRLLGEPRAVAVGVVADLCLLERPLDRALARAASGQGLGVRATLIGGKCVFEAMGPPTG